MLPPGLRPEWEDNSPWVQTLIIAYGTVRTSEDAKAQYEYLDTLFKALNGRTG